ncbi:50S ribosome-binding GTPase [Vulcanococcus limneticus Candia 3F8]|uniref:LeoA/HP0731 family dynamin-like GTPase n=1 Tax=Vulcanococcus limneticus TaxID=2170428 RepID=UPI000B99224B|nr:LeoA/HP0731 family dynamin-like GTPase [Vulcanococcus limneticus]MCP9793323.1 50S ribosome-binding GTPase [Vulcanococcus limneticus MW73D5]MCP9895332.1 50S ribosome-binding GTPase [Vulcanococcus limneticus Candia 3F8]MCP9898722.1 50S ribosome-binding GTPase [Vulcanococcus limneticus Candia 3B3]
MTTFQLADLQNRIESNLDELQSFLLSRGEPALQAAADALEGHRRVSRERPLLSLAFSGQYSAGKSTIISALTGDQTIRISADVATDEVKAYRWRDIELWDTPGLYADRADHTAKAEQAQREADLIVYCLTTNLFDNVTASDFRRLAFEKGYAPKLFLLINKLSMEDVDDTASYLLNLTSSIDRTLSPHRLSQFNHAFIDAQDYRDGLASSNQDLIRFSRFEAFVEQLNAWIKERGLLARLDPPIRLGLSTIDEGLATLPESTFEQNPQLFLLNEQLRIVQTQQRRTDAELRRLASGVIHEMQLLGEQLLSGELSDDPKLAEASFQSRAEEINKETYEGLNLLIHESYEQLQRRLDDFANEPLVADYFANVDASQAASFPTDDSTQGGNGNAIMDMAKRLLGKGAERFGLPGGLMTGTREMAGSAGHQLIYNVGKMFGKNFKPWEAVKMAKGLGQALAFVGIAMSAYEIYEQVNEEAKANEKQRQYEQQLQEARAQIRALADAMVAQLLEIYQKEYALPVIGIILERLNAERDRILAQEASNKELVEGLSSQRAQLKGYLKQLYATDQQVEA